MYPNVSCYLRVDYQKLYRQFQLTKKNLISPNLEVRFEKGFLKNRETIGKRKN